MLATKGTRAQVTLGLIQKLGSHLKWPALAGQRKKKDLITFQKKFWKILRRSTHAVRLYKTPGMRASLFTEENKWWNGHFQCPEKLYS